MSGETPIWNALNNSNSYTQTSDAHLIKASYLSLRNVTIGYSFPKAWMKKLGIGGIRVYVTGDNLAMWSKRQGFDPRVSMSGGNGSFGGYAPIRVISGGINLGGGCCSNTFVLYQGCRGYSLYDSGLKE